MRTTWWKNKKWYKCSECGKWVKNGIIKEFTYKPRCKVVCLWCEHKGTLKKWEEFSKSIGEIASEHLLYAENKKLYDLIQKRNEELRKEAFWTNILSLEILKREGKL